MQKATIFICKKMSQESKPKSIKRSLSLNLQTKVAELEKRASLKLNNFKKSFSKDESSLSSLERAKSAFRFKPFGHEAFGEYRGKKEHFLRGTDDVYYLLGDILGKGAYGTVYSAVRLDTKKYVAIKTLSSLHTKGDAIRESEIHELMGTSRGAPILARFNGKNSIVMKLIVGKKLESEYLDPDSIFSPLKLYRKAKKLLSELHMNHIYHGDTNTGNFIVESRTGKVFLVDYGSAGELTNLNKKLVDYRKLALNTIAELKYRNSEDVKLAFEEAKLDLQQITEICGIDNEYSD
jgi:serine/threonine protein kinase